MYHPLTKTWNAIPIYLGLTHLTVYYETYLIEILYLQYKMSQVIGRLQQKVITLEKNYKYLFDESIKLRLRSDVDVGIFLSGGLDSMSINHSLEKYSKKTIHKFVAKIEGKESIEKIQLTLKY